MRVTQHTFRRTAATAALAATLLAGCADPYERAMERGQRATLAEDYPAATAAFELAASAAGERAIRVHQARTRQRETLVAWAEARARGHRWEEALAPLERLAELEPEDPGPHCELANVAFRAGLTERARSFLSRCMERSQQIPLGERHRAMVQQVQGGLSRQALLEDGSLEALLELVRHHPGSAEGAVARALIPRVLAEQLQDPAAIGPPTIENPDPFHQLLALLLDEYGTSPEAADLQPRVAELLAQYQAQHASQLASVHQAEAEIAGATYCAEARLLARQLYDTSNEIGLQVEAQLHELRLARQPPDEARRAAALLYRTVVRPRQDLSVDLQHRARLLRSPGRTQEWLTRRIRTFADAVARLYELTEEYLTTLDDKANEQRASVARWCGSLSLDVQRDLRWICPRATGPEDD